MPKARYLAPWHQPDLWETLRSGGADPDADSLSEEALRALRGKPAIYHCISRVVDRRFVLGPAEREQFLHYMRLYEQFCQVRVLAHCVLSNHFHILVEVPAAPEDRGRSWSDETFLRHLAVLYSGAKLRGYEEQLARLRAQGNSRGAEEFRERFLRRLWDLSEFMKTLKQRFTRWFNNQHDRKGTLWEERFKSTLVESGLAARAVAGYIDLNPVRAGIVTHPEDYRWSSLGEALAGHKRAREGLQRVMFERARHATDDERAAGTLLSWRKTLRRYREILEADRRRGEADAETAMAETRPLRELDLLRKKVRYFADGLVIGSARFVDTAWALRRERFGPKRTSGARKMRHHPEPLDTELRSLRDLHREPFG